MNIPGIAAIFKYEMNRFMRTRLQSIVTPMVTTSLYFIVFGSAVGSHMGNISGVSYGNFIVPGVLMLSLLTQTLSNAAFAIYMPKFSGSVYEILAAPLSPIEIIIGYVGAAVAKSLILACLILITARCFVAYEIDHPIIMVAFMLLTAMTFSLFGFAIGLWADTFEKLQIVPMMIVTPLTFLGGSFYSIKMLPEFWQTVTLFNPVVYLINGLRWSFYSIADVAVGISFGAICIFMALCITLIWWMFRTGYKLKA